MMAGIAGASAHVSVDPEQDGSKLLRLLTFGVPHGCDTSGTTKVAISLPEELTDATADRQPNWTVEKVTETLAEPKKLDDGTTITKRTSQIVYTAKAPLDPHMRDALVLSVKLPDAAGKTIYFPTYQTCERARRTGSRSPRTARARTTSSRPPRPSLSLRPTRQATTTGQLPCPPSRPQQ
jgi:uncharacterized protein YcnI